MPNLITERLQLRKPKLSDWEAVSYLRSDPIVNQFVKRPSAETKEKALAFLNKAIQDIENKILYYWIITEKDHEQMIGSICLWNLSEDRKKAEVGYDLSPAFHKKGIMNEALVSVLQFGFQTLALEFIEAYTQRNNPSSLKLLERNGFVMNEDRNDPDNEYNLIYELKVENYSKV